MSAPKITYVHRTQHEDWLALYASGARMGLISREGVEDALAACRQRLDIPDDVRPGWGGVPEDLPTPEPLPERWARIDDGPYWAGTAEGAQGRRSSLSPPLPLVHVWTDAYGVDHAEVIRP